MALIVDLMLLLSRAPASRFLPSKSVALNLIAIASSVAFLAFALAVYDGYKLKVEGIIFSLTPHVMVRPIIGPPAEEGTADDEVASCIKVCQAPFTVKQREGAKPRKLASFDAAREQVIRDWIAHAPVGTSASRVLFEEVKLEVRSIRFSTEGLRTMRLLGIEPLHGTTPSPRVDLAFTDATVANRFRMGAGVLVSDAFAREIEEADGKPVVPNRSVLQLGTSADQLREVSIIGIHHLGIHAMARNLLIAPYAIVREVMGPDAPSGPSYIGVSLAEPSSAREVARGMRSVVRPAELAAIAWHSVTDLFDQLELYRWIIYVTLSLSILVTGINTFINVSVVIMERAQQIGIMRAMGLSPRRLLAVFTAMGILQSIVGTTVGYAIGILLGYQLDDYINSLVRDFVPIENSKVAPDPVLFLQLLVFVTFVSTLTCLWAGRRALRNDIVENLRSV